jgi:hypothetical protein
LGKRQKQKDHTSVTSKGVFGICRELPQRITKGNPPLSAKKYSSGEAGGFLFLEFPNVVWGKDKNKKTIRV